MTYFVQTSFVMSPFDLSNAFDENSLYVCKLILLWIKHFCKGIRGLLENSREQTAWWAQWAHQDSQE